MHSTASSRRNSGVGRIANLYSVAPPVWRSVSLTMWLAVENGKILLFLIQARRFQHILS